MQEVDCLWGRLKWEEVPGGGMGWDSENGGVEWCWEGGGGSGIRIEWNKRSTPGKYPPTTLPNLKTLSAAVYLYVRHGDL